MTLVVVRIFFLDPCITFCVLVILLGYGKRTVRKERGSPHLAHREATEHVLGSQRTQGVGVALKAVLLYDSIACWMLELASRPGMLRPFLPWLQCYRRRAV